jgi:uncharacterized protein
MLFVICMMGALCGFDENGQKVYDGANLFTDAEEERLTQKAVEMAEELSLDVIICTTNSTGGSSIDDYAYEFYEAHGFGYDGKNGAGVMLAIDMGKRKLTVYESQLEDENFLFLDSELDAIIDAVSPYLTKEDYYGGAVRFISLLPTYADDDGVTDPGAYDGSGTMKYIVDGTAEEDFRWLSRLVTGIIIATIAVLVMHLNQKSKKVTNPHVYMRDDRLDLREHSDIYTHTTTVRHRIEHESSGGGGGGHSGGSHSGGGSHSHSRSGGF